LSGVAQAPFYGEKATQVEITDMNRRIFVLALGLAAALALPRVVLAAEDHLGEAITHTQEAIKVGKEGKAKELVAHAEQALKHAKAAEEAQANPHTKQGITHLEAAISTGEKNDAKGATSHAEEALTHLEQAKK
jgi:hypothetical protein